MNLFRFLAAASVDDATLPQPLPTAVRRVARAQCAALGSLVVLSAVTLAIGAVGIVIMPFAFGRRGVGMAMVSLFVFCATAVLTTLPYFAARGGARILHHDARGIAPVNRVAWLTILFAIPVGFAGALGLDFLTPSEDMSSGLSVQSRVFLAILAVFVLLAVWTITVLRAYKKTLPAHVL